MIKEIFYSIALGILGAGYLGRFEFAVMVGCVMIAVLTLAVLYIYRLVLWDMIIGRLHKN